MGFLAQGVSPECFYGCPDIDFKGQDAKLAALQQDAALPDLSEHGLAVLRQAADDITARITGGRPVDKLTGPWRGDVPEPVRNRHSGLVCCRYAGVVIVEGPGKTHEILRPGAESAAEDQPAVSSGD
jgi:hypothetical protein